MPGFSGQGKIYLGKRTATGGPAALRWIGNASVFRVGLSQDRRERKESYSGARGTHRSMTTGRAGEVTIVFDEFKKTNMAYIMLGDVQAVAAASFTNRPLPNGLVNGDTVALPWRDITVSGITDSATTPATVATNKYTVDSESGLITFIGAINTFTQPLKASGSYTEQDLVGAYNILQDETYILFDGTNTDNNEKCRVEVFRVRLEPATTVDWINNDDFSDYELKGSVLIDNLKAANAAGGQYYQVLLGPDAESEAA